MYKKKNTPQTCLINLTQDLRYKMFDRSNIHDLRVTDLMGAEAYAFSRTATNTKSSSSPLSLHNTEVILHISSLDRGLIYPPVQHVKCTETAPVILRRN